MRLSSGLAMSARARSTLPCPRGNASPSAAVVAAGGTRSASTPQSRSAVSVAGPIAATRARPSAATPTPSASALPRSAATPLTLVSTTHSYAPAASWPTARSRSAVESSGSIAMVGTSSGSAPRSRSSRENAPACSRARGTSTVSPSSGRSTATSSWLSTISRGPVPAPKRAAPPSGTSSGWSRPMPAGLDKGAHLRATGVQQAGGQRLAETLGVVERTCQALADQPLSVRRGQEPMHLQAAAHRAREQEIGRESAGAPQLDEESALAAQGGPRGPVGDRPDQAEHAGVVLACLHSQASLGGGRRERLRVQRGHQLVAETEPK